MAQTAKARPRLTPTPKALEKARGEKVVQKAIAAGMRAKTAFEKFGIM